MRTVQWLFAHLPVCLHLGHQHLYSLMESQRSVPHTLLSASVDGSQKLGLSSAEVFWKSVAQCRPCYETLALIHF